MQYANAIQTNFTEIPSTTLAEHSEVDELSPASFPTGLNSETSIILLGAALLSFAAFQFLKRLGKTMTADPSK